MTLDLLLAFVMVSAAAWTLFIGVPSLARDLLVGRVLPLRDRLMTAVINDELDATDRSVDLLRLTLEAAVATPELFGLTEAAAVHLAHLRTGVPFPEGPSVKGLPPAQQAMVEELRKQLAQALRRYLVFGSRFWPLLGFVVLVRRGVLRWKAFRHEQVDRTQSLMVSTIALAEEVVVANEETFSEHWIDRQAKRSTIAVA